MNFERLCESYGVFKSVKREFYPKNISFSPKFIESVKEEYVRQRQQVQENLGIVRDHRNKFLKALNFHLRDIENSIVNEMSQAECLKKEVAAQRKANKAVTKEQPKILKRNIGKV